MNIKEANKYFPAVLIPIHEFNTKSRTIEPMIPLIDQLIQQSSNEYEKIKTKKKYIQKEIDYMDLNYKSFIY